MRRLIALLVVALLGATLYGASNLSSGVSVAGSRVSGTTLRNELAAITSNPTLACYIAALNTASFAPGAGGASMDAAGAAEWTNLRVEGLAIDNFATTSLHFHPNAATLAKAKASLESELSQAAASEASANPQSPPCTGTSADAVAAMPSEMRNFEIAAQAASLDLVSKLNTTVPLTVASMMTYYSTHSADYDTICVSVAVVDPTNITAFNAAQTAGMSVAQLAEKFSADASAKKGGVYGCFGPSDSSYSGVREATQSTPLNTFPTTPEEITYNGAEAALFVAPTKRTPTPFAQAEASILSDLENANAAAANLQKERILSDATASISVDPSFGRWGVGTSGDQVFAPATPTSAVVGSSTISSLGAGASTYK